MLSFRYFKFNFALWLLRSLVETSSNELALNHVVGLLKFDIRNGTFAFFAACKISLFVEKTTSTLLKHPLVSFVSKEATSSINGHNLIKGVKYSSTRKRTM